MLDSQAWLKIVAGISRAVKLADKADTIIANGAECEPLLHKNAARDGAFLCAGRLPPQPAGQPVVAFGMNLQTERQLGRHSHTSPSRGAANRSSRADIWWRWAAGRSYPCLVVPGLENLIGFRRLKQIDQIQRVATLWQNPGDPILLAEVFALHVLDSQTGRTDREQGMIPHPIAQYSGEHLQIEAGAVIPSQPSFRRSAMAHVGDCPGDDDAIPTTQCSDDLVCTALGQQF